MKKYLNFMNYYAKNISYINKNINIYYNIYIKYKNKIKQLKLTKEKYIIDYYNSEIIKYRYYAKSYKKIYENLLLNLNKLNNDFLFINNKMNNILLYNESINIFIYKCKISFIFIRKLNNIIIKKYQKLLFNKEESFYKKINCMLILQSNTL